ELLAGCRPSTGAPPEALVDVHGLPLTGLQHSFWLQWKAAPPSTANHVASALRAIPFDVAALRAAAKYLAKRHPQLSARFAEDPDGTVRQYRADSGDRILVEHVDAALDDDALRARVAARAARPIDLRHDPLFRIE